MANRTLAFLGLGKRKTPGQQAEAAAALDTEARRRRAEEGGGSGEGEGASAQDVDDDEEDEDDEEETGSEEERQAIRRRNALRAAGHRRGQAAERARLAATFNDLDPGRVELALHLALNTDLPAEQLRGAVDKAPAPAARTAFAAAMDQVSRRDQPGFGAAGGAPKLTLSGRMAELLKTRG